MTANNNQPQAPTSPPPPPADAAATLAPLDRIWGDPIGTGEPVPFDPAEYAPGMSDEEIKKYLEEQEKE